jgi:aspartyl-tRNA(Asn)/glutamyl-tRNA(Gln) amidotransferase subunit B
MAFSDNPFGNSRSPLRAGIRSPSQRGELAGRESPAQESDAGAIEAAVDAVVAGNADKVAEYQGGKANLQVVNELSKQKPG